MDKRKKSKTLTKQVKNRNRKLMLYYFFIVAFGLSYHLISNTDWFLSIAKPIFNGYANLSSSILSILGQETTAIGDQINSSVCNLQIKEGCDGITPMILYSAAILAFPIHFKFKWQGVVYGMFTLIVLNIIRIVSLYFVGKYGSQSFFEFMHEDFWSILFLVIALLLWIKWMQWALITKAAPKVSY